MNRQNDSSSASSTTDTDGEAQLNQQAPAVNNSSTRRLRHRQGANSHSLQLSPIHVQHDQIASGHGHSGASSHIAAASPSSFLLGASGHHHHHHHHSHHTPQGQHSSMLANHVQTPETPSRLISSTLAGISLRSGHNSTSAGRFQPHQDVSMSDNDHRSQSPTSSIATDTTSNTNNNDGPPSSRTRSRSQTRSGPAQAKTRISRRSQSESRRPIVTSAVAYSQSTHPRLYTIQPSNTPPLDQMSVDDNMSVVSATSSSSSGMSIDAARAARYQHQLTSSTSDPGPLSATSSSGFADMDGIEGGSSGRVPGRLKSKNPLMRLSRLLLEDAKIADTERVGERVIKEDITQVMHEATHDDEGDAVMMDEETILVLQRRGAHPGSHLNPSYQGYSPSPSSSSTPSPTASHFPPYPGFPSSSSSSSANTIHIQQGQQSPYYYAYPSSPMAISTPTARSPRGTYALPISRTTSPPLPPLILKRPRTSSLSEGMATNGHSSSSRASSVGSTSGGAGGGPPPTKRVRVNDDAASTPVSPSLLARNVSMASAGSAHGAGAAAAAAAAAARQAWVIPGNNASKQVPQLLNIQGASLAFSRMDLDDEQMAAAAAAAAAQRRASGSGWLWDGVPGQGSAAASGHSRTGSVSMGGSKSDGESTQGSAAAADVSMGEASSSSSGAGASGQQGVSPWVAYMQQQQLLGFQQQPQPQSQAQREQRPPATAEEVAARPKHVRRNTAADSSGQSRGK